MKNTFNLILITLLAISLVSAACEGPAGPTGPQGPQGEQGTEGPGSEGTQGEQGPPGPQGPAGEDGQDGQDGEDGQDGQDGETGTANVIYSEWIPKDWNLEDTNTTKVMGIDEARLTEEFLETGVILFFIRGSSVTFSVPYSAANTTYFFYASPEHTLLQFRATKLNGMSGNVMADWIEDVRYVLIPGGVPAKMGDNFLKDYEAVKEYYGILD